MKRLFLIACLMTLSACGADGPPQAPVQTGLVISGDAQIGIVSN